MTKKIEYLEIEVKFRADDIDRMAFKDLVRKLNPKEFLYIESTDTYFIREGDDFLRYRASAENTKDKRSELTFKKKHSENDNIIRTEVNLRVDPNKPELVTEFVEGLGYTYNFSIVKFCDIYYMSDVNLVYYTIKDDNGKYASFIEIEVIEGSVQTEEEGWEVMRKYEKLFEPFGITPQNRLRKSLFEMYRKDEE